jgi:transposase
MTAWHTREELIAHVVSLAKQGLTRRAIARALQVSRNTVRTLLREHEAGRSSEQIALPQRPTRAPRPSKLDPYKPRVQELMARYPEITAQRIFEILRDEGFVGGYTAVKKHVRKERPRPKPTPSLTTPSYGPGEMSESDWSPYEIRFLSGKTTIVQALSYVLVGSKRKYFGLYDSNDLHALMDGRARLRALRRPGAPVQVRQPEARGPALGRQPAPLQPSLPGVL